MGFLRQEYWGGLPLPPPGDLPDPGIELVSLMCLALAGRFFTAEPPGKPKVAFTFINYILLSISEEDLDLLFPFMRMELDYFWYLNLHSFLPTLGVGRRRV